MNIKHAYFVSIIAVVIGMMPVNTAYAQEEAQPINTCDDNTLTWSSTYDFAVSDFGWEAVAGNSTGLFGHYTGDYWDSDDETQISRGISYRQIWLYRQVFNSSETLTSVDMTYDLNVGYVSPTYLYDEGDNGYSGIYFPGIVGVFYYYDTVVQGDGQHMVWSGTKSDFTSLYMVALSDVDGLGGYSNFTGYAHVTGLVLEGTYAEAGQCPVVPTPTGPFRPIRTDILYEVNHVTGYGPIVDDVHTELAADVYNSFSGTVVAISTAGTGYMVKVVADDDTYAIYDNLSTVNPSLNDQIVAGCVLGTVGESFKAPSQTYTQNPGLLWYYPGTDFYDFETNEYIDWQTEYEEPPLTAIPCGSTLITPHCLNYNPSLDDRAAGWTAVNIDEYDIGDTRVKLTSMQTSLSQMIILDHEANYYVDLKTEQYGSLYDYISLVLMKATDFTILSTETITLESDNLGDELLSQIGPLDFNSDFDVNDAYLIAIVASNPNTSGVWIDDVCINLGDAQVGIPNCYFDNFQLDGDTGWDSSEGADWSSNPDTFGTGVVLGPGDWISQPLALSAYADAAADYTLTVTAKTTAIDLGDIIDIFTTGWVADLSQEVKTGETVELDIGDVTVNNVLISLQYITDFTVDYETTLAGDLTITSDPLNEKDVYIDWICLDAKTGVWPGDENNDIETGELDSCDACSMPTSTVNLFEWLVWLWCNISRFFNCTLILWLNYLQSLIRQLGDLIGLIGRYIGVIVGQVATWLMALIVAFGIALRDLLIYGASLIWNFLADLGFIRLLYDLIGYAIAIVTGVIHIGDIVLTAIGLLFGALLTLGRLAGIFVASLSAGLSGDVATITIPSCATPSSPVWEGFCVVFQMADGLFAEFPALGVGMIIDAALIGLITSVWTVRSIGGALGDI